MSAYPSRSPSSTTVRADSRIGSLTSCMSGGQAIRASTLPASAIGSRKPSGLRKSSGIEGAVQRRINGGRRGRFERGGVDDVFLAGELIYKLQSLSVYNDGSDSRPDWYLERIEVQRDDEDPLVFAFDRWIKAKSAETVSIGP